MAKKKSQNTKSTKKQSVSKKTPIAKIKAKKVTAEIVSNNLPEETEVSDLKTENLDFHNDLSIQTTEQTKDKSLATADPVTLYLTEIQKYPLLTREQEHELAVKFYETKDPQLAQALVTANLRFVVKVAAEYSKFGSRMIDLIQEGNVGLMHAVKEFNPYKGVRLITYAVWWIRGYIQEYLMKQYSMVKIGTTQNQRKLFYRLQKEKNNLDQLGEIPTAALLSEKLGIPQDEIEDMSKRLRNKDVSLDAPLDSDSGNTLSSFQSSQNESPDDELSRKELISILYEKIDEIKPELNEREKILLEERLLSDEPLTLQEIGEKYKITREAVRQAEVRLMNKIKEKMKDLS